MRTVAKKFVVIRSKNSPFTINWNEIWASRDLFYFLTWRDIKIRYKQTILGVAWMILQPLISMVLFTIIFGNFASIPSDNIPYPIFVFIGLLVLTLFVLSIGDFQTMALTYEVNFIFNFANGVKIGAPVRFAGVDVGEIKEINFVTTPGDPRSRVCIVGLVKKDIKIPVDSSIWVNTLGLLGEKYIEIMPGKDYSQFVTAKQAIVGVDPIPMQEVSVLAKEIAQNLNDGLLRIINKEGTVGKLLYDDAIYKNLEALVADIKSHPWKLFWKGKEKPVKK